MRAHCLTRPRSRQAAEGKVEEFEARAQGGHSPAPLSPSHATVTQGSSPPLESDLVRSMYHLAAGITDVRVCHPCCGEVCFIVTFLSARDRERFDSGPRRDAEIALSDVVEGGTPIFSTTGTLMPAAHTLTSLLEWLTVHVVGGHHSAHDVRAVSRELAKWFPRPSEWSKFATWNKADPNKYTRNVVLQNDNNRTHYTKVSKKRRRGSI